MRTLVLAGSILLGAFIVRCDAPNLSCDTDYECSQLPPCYLKQKDFEKGLVPTGCDGGPWSEPYYYVGHYCDIRGHSKYGNKPLAGCLWSHKI